MQLLDHDLRARLYVNWEKRSTVIISWREAGRKNYSLDRNIEMAAFTVNGIALEMKGI